MKTRAEQLPIEIWILIFTYLEIHDLLQVFTNLNHYFNDILASNHLSFNLELRANDNDNTQHTGTFNLSNAILNRIICLQSSIKTLDEYFSEFFHQHGDELLRLQSLIIKANTQEISSICLALQQLNTIRYLSLTCIPNQELLEVILAAPSLRKCRLQFWRVTTPISYHVGANSNIEILSIKLQDNQNHSIMNLFLSHMSNIKKLEIIEENFINNDSHPLFSQQLFVLPNLEILKLTWGYHDIQSNCFQHLFAVIPNLKHLYLKMFYYSLNQSLFENLINGLLLVLEKMKPIKITILCRRLMATTENNLQTIFHNYCQQILHTINSRFNSRFEVKWIQENLKRHKIEITFKKF